MIRIHFTDLETKQRALGFLAGRFSFKSWATGEMIVPEPALASLARALRFSDAQLVPDALIAETLLELEERVGTVSSETQIIRGYWRHEGQAYRDALVRVFVDAPDLPESLQFFGEFKERLKARFRQIDVWMTTYLVEVL